MRRCVKISPSCRALTLLSAALCLLLPACQQQMAEQPSYRPYDPSAFFPDGRAVRPLVHGTVARGQLRTDQHLFAGTRAGADRRPLFPAAFIGAVPAAPLIAASLAASASAAEEQLNAVAEFPFPVTFDVIQHGQNRFMIYCVVCHDPQGTGRGMIVQRGYTQPPSYHIDRLRQAPVGHFYKVITLGYGSMPAYRKQVPPRDRWAIIAYIRALQLSQHFPADELTAEMQQEWQKQKQAAQPAQSGGKAP